MNATAAHQSPLPFESLPPLLQWGFAWLERQPIIAALLGLMALDILCGLALSAAKKTLSSSVSWRGMSKKAIMLIMVGASSVLEPFTNGIPLSRLVGIFYMVTETISILENGAAAGVPLPGPLIDTLSKLKDGARALRQSTPPAASVSLTVESKISPQNMAVVIPGNPSQETKVTKVEVDPGNGI